MRYKHLGLVTLGFAVAVACGSSDDTDGSGSGGKGGSGGSGKGGSGTGGSSGTGTGGSSGKGTGGSSGKGTGGSSGAGTGGSSGADPGGAGGDNPGGAGGAETGGTGGMGDDDCGNGVLDAPEECDLGGRNSDALISGCTTSCRLTSLVAWFDASDPTAGGATPAPDSAVSVWRDLARDNDAVQATVGRQPLYRVSGIHGEPALRFDGTDDALEVPVDINPATRNDITVFAVFQNTAGTTSLFAGVWGNDDGNWDRFIGAPGTSGGYGVSNGTGFTTVPGFAREGVPLVSSVTLRNDAGADTSTVHVNGSLEVSFAESHSNPGVAMFLLGNIQGPPGANTHAFDGHIAEFLLFERALTNAEREEVEATLKSRYLDPPVAAFRVDADIHEYACGSSGVWFDQVDGRTGTLTGGFATASCDTSTGWVGGTEPFALNFGAVADEVYVEYPYEASLNPMLFTAEVWAQVEGGTGNFRSPLTSRDDPPLSGYIFYATPTDTWEAWLGNGTWVAISGGPVVNGQWTHLALSYDGALMRFYVDGELAGSTPLSNYIPNDSRSLRIGAGATELTPPAYFFSGQVAKAVVYDGVVDDSGIRARYQADAGRF